MPDYFVQNRVRTVANLFGPIEFRDYHFEIDGPDEHNQCWSASRTLSSENAREAFRQFRADLFPIVDALSVMTQCWFTLSATSYLICRTTDNERFDFFVCHFRQTQPVGIPFWNEQQQQDLERLLSSEYLVALHYLRESNAASTGKARLALLLITAEALAGSGERYHTCSECGHRDQYAATDPVRLQDIIGEQAYRRLYRGERLRHRLFHGSGVSDDELGNLPNYDAVFYHVTTECRLEGIEQIVNAPRGQERFEHIRLCLRPRAPSLPDLRQVEADLEGHHQFEVLDRLPDDY